MCNDGLSAEACRLVADLLLSAEEGGEGCPPLETLHFYNNMCDYYCYSNDVCCNCSDYIN